jgi:PKD repeat protein
MKNTLLQRAGLMALGFLSILIVSQIVFGNAAAPPAGKSGAPGENKCLQCHGGTAGTGSLSMVFGNNETQYVPGQVYAISVNVTDATKLRFGFQITALAGGVGATVGTFALTNTTTTSSQTATVTGHLRKYVSHRSANATQNWSFNWTAPATDIGPITFFLVGLASNNSNSSAGDKVYSLTSTITAVPPPPPVAAVSVTDTSACVGTAVTFEDQSTNSPSTHTWSFPGGTPSTSTAANPSVVYAVSGFYDVTLITGNVTGADTITLTSYIHVYDLPVIIALPTPTSCFGGDNGRINLTATGAGGFTYAWSNGTTAEDPTNLVAGSYTVTVTDQNGCSNTANFIVAEPTEVTLLLSSQPADCGISDGSVMVSPSGGVGPYQYLWSTGDTNATAFNVGAGSYDVTVHDANGCQQIGTVGVSNTGAPSGAASAVEPTCNGDIDGSIDLVVTGGTAPYTYQWSNGASTQDLTGLPAGTYTVTVTSADGCVLTQVVTLNEPTLLTTTVGSTPEISGDDGTATVTVAGGNGGYSYLWSNGQTGATATGLSAGTYSVTVTDSLGCNTSTTVNVSLVISVAGPLTQELFTVGPNPFNDFMTLTPNVTIYGRFTVHLIDIEGRIVFGAALDAKGAAPVRFSPGPLPNGVYLLMIHTAKGDLHKKVIHHER